MRARRSPRPERTAYNHIQCRTVLSRGSGPGLFRWKSPVKWRNPSPQRVICPESHPNLEVCLMRGSFRLECLGYEGRLLRTRLVSINALAAVSERSSCIFTWCFSPWYHGSWSDTALCYSPWLIILATFPIPRLRCSSLWEALCTDLLRAIIQAVLADLDGLSDFMPFKSWLTTAEYSIRPVVRQFDFVSPDGRRPECHANWLFSAGWCSATTHEMIHCRGLWIAQDTNFDAQLKMRKVEIV